MTNFVGVYTKEGYTKLQYFGMCNGTPFCDFILEFCVLECKPLRRVSVFCLRGRMWCWRWFGWRRTGNFRLSGLRCTLVQSQRTRGHTPRWMLCGWLLVAKLKIRQVPSTAKHFLSLLVSSTGARSSPTSGPRPADHLRGQGRVPSQSLSWQTGIEPSLNCHAHR